MADTFSEDGVKSKRQIDVDLQGSKREIRPAASSAGPYNKDLVEIRNVVSRYFEQLLHGCGDATCTEALCDTGRRNVSQKPIRKYTPRAARAIALALASGPRPRGHLCTKIVRASEPTRSSSSEGPRDPSSFIQQLCDTSTVRNLDDVSYPRIPRDGASSHRTSGSDSASKDYVLWHIKLSNLSKLCSTSEKPTLASIQKENGQIATALSHCLSWLLRGLPSGTAVQWKQVNRVIGKGNVYPASNVDVAIDTSHNSSLDILDALEYEPSFRLLCDALAIMARRDIKERQLIRAAKCEDEPGIFGHLITSIVPKFFSKDQSTGLPVRLDFVIWLKKAFLRHWDGGVRVAEGTISFIALEILDNICGHGQKSRPSKGSQEDLLDMLVVASRLDAIELVRTWREGPQEGHLLNYRFLFTTNQLTTYFRMSNHLSMRKVNSDAETASAIRSRDGRILMDERLNHLMERYLLLNVSRERVLQDAFDQLWQRRRAELLLPLRVRLGEMDGLEVGHDLGGVQIEFFNLICKALLDESNQLFTTDASIGLSYFRAGSLQPLYMFELCGLLIALAIYNGISIPVNFPDAFYNMLCGEDQSLDSIRDAWPVVERSLREIRASSSENLSIDESFPLEANGLRLSVGLSEELSMIKEERLELPVYSATPIAYQQDRMNDHATTAESDQPHSVEIDISNIADAWPGWRLRKALEPPAEVTSSDERAEYVQNYVYWLTVGSVKPQWVAFLKGFKSIPIDLSIIPPENLRAIVEGSTHFDMKDLRRVTTYDGFEPTSKYIRSFWQLVMNWPAEKQKQLLKFVTACERIPPGGASSLTFRIQEAAPFDLDHLPTSSTCFGTLVLPKYESVTVLDKKLSLALKYGVEGFGSG